MNIGLVYNWPGGKNSELDLIGRICLVLDKQGHKGIIIDPFGKLLDLSGEYVTPVEFVDESCLDFALNFHYTSPNYLDTYSYFTNWNPLEYLRRHPATGSTIPFDQELMHVLCMNSHDFALDGGSKEVEHFFNAINICNPVFDQSRGRIKFYPTCQLGEDIPPVELEDTKIFYIGVNWERLAVKEGSDTRHGGMLEQLDATDFVELYGVKKLNGVEIWDGFNNYKGELPFDNGESIINRSNKCGISLVLSSKAHRYSGLVSTRLFQACAARTVIISDDNSFIKDNFGDSVITFEYDDNPDVNFQRISEAYQWIIKNKALAKEKAEKAHKIFTEKFLLEEQIANLVSRHNEWTQQQDTLIINDIVEVVWVLQHYSDTELERFVTNLNKQENVKIVATIILTAEIVGKVSEILSSKANFNYILHSEEKLSRPTGFYIERYAKWQENSSYLCIYTELSEWMSRHLYWLASAIMNTGTQISQSGTCLRNELWNDQYRIKKSYKVVNSAPVTDVDIRNTEYEKYCASSFLISKTMIDSSIMSVVSNLNFITWYAFIIRLYQHDKSLPIFVPKLSIKLLPEINHITEPEYIDDRDFLLLSFNLSDGEKARHASLESINRESYKLSYKMIHSEGYQLINSESYRLINKVVTYNFIMTKIRRGLELKNSKIIRVLLKAFTLFSKPKSLK